MKPMRLSPWTSPGRLSAESRLFPAAPAFSGQRSAANGFVAEPTLYVDNGAGWSFTLVPFFRYDHADPQRTHFDLREAYLLLFGDGWEVRLGVEQVFWGVAESQRLVDIVNQVDLVEHPERRGEARAARGARHVVRRLGGIGGSGDVLPPGAHVSGQSRSSAAALRHRS